VGGKSVTCKLLIQTQAKGNIGKNNKHQENYCGELKDQQTLIAENGKPTNIADLKATKQGLKEESQKQRQTINWKRQIRTNLKFNTTQKIIRN
jgi:hypothetical protein